MEQTEAKKEAGHVERMLKKLAETASDLSTVTDTLENALSIGLYPPEEGSSQTEKGEPQEAMCGIANAISAENNRLISTKVQLQALLKRIDL